MTLDVIHNEDCLSGMKRLPDNSVDLIATDPPYFRVKGESWDRQWDNSAKFIEWIGELCQEWRRVLKPHGSLYCFASRAKSAQVETKITEYFAVLNRITWAKPAFSTKAEMFRKSDLRSYFPVTEEIIFAEHFGSDNIAKGEAGYAAKCDQLCGFWFEPIRSYLASERRAAKLTGREVNRILGLGVVGGGMSSHYFGRSQWCLPTAEHYAKLAKATGRFQRLYETLREQYETLRRPFAIGASVPFTDVWTFPTVSSYPGKHPCEKPLAMMEHILTASSRPGAVVLDCFLGGGTTAVACINTDRHYIGFEKDPKYFQAAQSRIRKYQPALLQAA